MDDTRHVAHGVAGRQPSHHHGDQSRRERKGERLRNEDLMIFKPAIQIKKLQTEDVQGSAS